LSFRARLQRSEADEESTVVTRGAGIGRRKADLSSSPLRGSSPGMTARTRNQMPGSDGYSQNQNSNILHQYDVPPHRTAPRGPPRRCPDQWHHRPARTAIGPCTLRRTTAATPGSAAGDHNARTAGRIPHEPESTMTLITKVLGETPIPPRELQADISAPLSDIVLRAASRDREDRSRSASELHDWLDRLG
jgi:hypothetical protein